jgi:hypothetical protein
MPLRREQIFAADLRKAILDYPVKIRWNGAEIDASFNGGRIGVDAVDGGILIDDNATLLACYSDFVLPLPKEGSNVDVRKKDGVTWKTYEVIGVVETNDPLATGVTLVIGPTGKR